MTKEFKMPGLALRKILFLSLGFSVASAAVPQKIEHVDFRSLSKPLNLKIEKASPAVSALEDARFSYYKPKSIESVVKAKTYAKLSAGEIKTSKKSNSFKLVSLQPLYIPAGSNTKSTYMDARQKRLRLAKSYIDNYPAQPSLMERARELVQAELIKDSGINEATNSRTIRSNSGSDIIVSRVTRRTLAKSNSKKPNSKTKATTRRNPNRTIIKVASNDKQPKLASKQQEDSSMALGFMSDNVAEELRPRTIQGLIIYPESLRANTYGQTIVITQRYFGETLAEGYLVKNTNRFRMPIVSPLGEILVQLYNEDGLLLAKSKVLTTSVTGVAPFLLEKADDRLAINIKQKYEKLAEPVKLTLAFGLKEAKLTAKGAYKFLSQEVLQPSHLFIQAQAQKSFVSLVSWARAGFENTLTLMSLEDADSLFQSFGLRAFTKQLDQAFIYGRIKYKGQPVSHANVDLAFRSNEKVFYPNQEVNSAQMTGESGEFFIPSLNTGLEFLRAQQLIGFKSFPVLVSTILGHMSSLDLNISAKKTVEVVATELFTPTVLASLANVLGDEQIFSSDNEGVLGVEGHFMNGLTLLEIDAGEEHLLSRVAVTAYNQNQRVSMISLPWLNHLYESGKLNKNSQNFVHGEVTGSNYKVFVDSVSPADYQVLYFNEDGSLSDNNYGRAGFIVSGLTTGLHSVRIQPEGSEKYILQQVYIDERASHYLNINLSAY